MAKQGGECVVNAGLNEKKSPIISFGPGTVLMLVAVFAIVCWQYLFPEKVKVQREIVSNTSIEPIAEPGLADLINWKARLKINTKQLIELKNLEVEEEKKLIALDKEIKGFYSDFNCFVAAGKSNSITIADIKQASSPISSLSAKKRHIMRHYAQAGLAIIDREQRSLAYKLAREVQIRHREQGAGLSR